MKGKNTIFKWLAVFAMILAIAAPAVSKEVYAAGNTYCVSVSSGYLALRTAKSYDRANEIGELYTGDIVKVSDYSDSTYWYVYSVKHGKSGYVNKNYLFSTVGSSWTVSVNSGYLALRTAKAYDSSNEIGELYSGETVRVYDATDSTYWYVYSPKYDRYGYVNKDYLFGGSISDSSDKRTVAVSSGYLALRNAKAYDSGNEIGELYTGDVVQVLDRRDSTYWYVYSPKHGKSGYVNNQYLVSADSEKRTVQVNSGYLALRTAKAYDETNEIGELYTGDTVQLMDTSDSTYWYVYSPKHQKSGYVNCNYLSGGANNIKTVKVNSGYLALRTAAAYDSNNEIGELYNGDQVQVVDKENASYWYVYSPKYGKYGYVNKDYLY